MSLDLLDKAFADFESAANKKSDLKEPAQDFFNALVAAYQENAHNATNRYHFLNAQNRGVIYEIATVLDQVFGDRKSLLQRVLTATQQDPERPSAQ